MNVLITVHTYVPNADGVEYVTKYLAEGLVRRGHSVQIITNMYPDRCAIREEVINGVNVLRWNATTSHTFHKGDKKKYQKYIIENQSKYDVLVNVGTQTALTDWILPIYKKITIPHFLYIHSIWDFKIYDTDKESLKKLFSKIWANFRWYIYFKINKNAFRSYSMVSQLHEKDYSYEFFLKQYSIKSKIIENAAEDVFFEINRYESEKEGEKYAVYVANYNPGKDQKRCLQLFYESNIPDNWKLIFIGSSATHYYSELLKYNQQLMDENEIKKSKAEFLVNIPRNEVITYISNASLFIMTSQREAFPVSIVESISAGVPFVSTDVGIVKYIPGGITKSKDNEIKEAIELLINNGQLRNEYGKNGRTYAFSHFRQTDKIDQFESYLLEIIRRK